MPDDESPRSPAGREDLLRSGRRGKGLDAVVRLGTLAPVRMPVERLLTYGVEAIGAGVGALYRLDVEHGRLQLAGAGQGSGGDRPEWPVLVDLDEGVLGWVATERKARFVPDAGDPMSGPLAPPGRWRAWLAVPIVRGGELFGVLVAGAVRPGVFDEDAELVLELIGERVATAIRTEELEAAERRSRLGVDHARRHLALLAQGTRALVAGLDDETAALKS